MSRCLFFSRKRRIKQAVIREIREAAAAPVTPQWNTKMNRESPITLMMFMMMDACMDILEFPMERNRAAQELYTARKG